MPTHPLPRDARALLRGSQPPPGPSSLPLPGRPRFIPETESSPLAKRGSQGSLPTGGGCSRGKTRGILSASENGRRAAPGRTAVPGRLRPGEPEAQRRAEAAQAGPADGGTAAALRGGPGPPPLRSRLPPLGNRRPGSGTQPCPPPPPRLRQGGRCGREPSVSYLSQAAWLLRVAAAQHSLELVHAARLGPRPSGSASRTAGLPFPSSGTTSSGVPRAAGGYLRSAGR